LSLEPHGLLTPFRRDRKQDLAHGGGGDDLVDAHVQQVLGTEPGELLWRTAFGTPLERLRHQRNDLVLAELGRVYVRDALRRWLGEAPTFVAVHRDGAALRVRVRVSVNAQRQSSRPIDIASRPLTKE